MSDAFNPSIWEAQAGEPLTQGPSWSTKWVPGQGYKMRSADFMKEQNGWIFCFDNTQCWSFNWLTEHKHPEWNRIICRGSLQWCSKSQVKTYTFGVSKLEYSDSLFRNQSSLESWFYCFKSWWDGSVVRITFCSSRVTKFSSQQPYRAVTPAPGELAPSSGFHEHLHSHPHMQNNYRLMHIQFKTFKTLRKKRILLF